jgi:hypothetical protein
MLSKQRFEGFQVARREPFQQLHLPLSISTYWFLGPMVTVYLGSSLFHSCESLRASGGQKGIQKEKARAIDAPGPISLLLK